MTDLILMQKVNKAIHANARTIYGAWPGKVAGNYAHAFDVDGKTAMLVCSVWEVPLKSVEESDIPLCRTCQRTLYRREHPKPDPGEGIEISEIVAEGILFSTNGDE